MAIVSDTILKTFFKTGDKPTAVQFATLIDSMINKLDDSQLLGLRIYDPQRVYTEGDTTLFDFSVYVCNAIQTTGIFKSADWKKVAGGTEGGLTYKGTWDAESNEPNLFNVMPSNGDYYVVSVTGNTELDGTTDWYFGDWAIYNGVFWQKINNSGIVTAADNYDGDGVGIFGELIDTTLQFRKLSSLNQSLNISENQNSKQVVLDINFDDEGISGQRVWSSEKMKQELNFKTDKVQGAVAGNFASLDALGNIQDSGKSPVDFDHSSGSLMALLKVADSEDVSQNRTATFASKLKMDFTPQTSGLHIGYWYFELSSTEQGVQMEGKVTLNDEAIGETMLISRHGTSTVYESISGMKITNLDQGRNYSMEILFRKRISEGLLGPYCRIRRARMLVLKA